MASAAARVLLRTILVLCAMPAAAGIAFAFALLAPGAIISAAMLGGLAGWAWHSVVSGDPAVSDRVQRWRTIAQPWRAAVPWRSAGYGVAAAIACAGNLAFLGPTTGLALITLCAGTWLTCSTALVPRAPQPRIVSDEIEDLVAPPKDAQTWADEARGLSDDALCLAWRASYVRLERNSGRELAKIALERRAYLDELERRNPAGFAAWMASGARAPSNPSRYLARPDQADPRDSP